MSPSSLYLSPAFFLYYLLSLIILLFFPSLSLPYIYILLIKANFSVFFFFLSLGIRYFNIVCAKFKVSIKHAVDSERLYGVSFGLCIIWKFKEIVLMVSSLSKSQYQLSSPSSPSKPGKQNTISFQHLFRI